MRVPPSAPALGPPARKNLFSYLGDFVGPAALVRLGCCPSPSPFAQSVDIGAVSKLLAGSKKSVVPEVFRRARLPPRGPCPETRTHHAALHLAFDGWVWLAWVAYAERTCREPG